MANKIKVKIKPIDKQYIPTYESDEAVGADLKSSESVFVHPGTTHVVEVGFSIQLPIGWEGQIRPRSSLSKRRINVDLGTIDSDYRGIVKVSLSNNSDEGYKIEKGARIAQFVLAPVYKFDFEESNELDETKRGTGGFGSTGQ